MTFKQSKCKICRQPATRRRGLVSLCAEIDCEVALGLKLLEGRKKEEKKIDSIRTKERKEKLKSRADWLAEVQKVFNAFIRERDKAQPCICCGRLETKVSGLHSHGWDAGHYRSVGSAPHMRFIENNVHKQLVYCNRNKSGNATDYRIGLIARIGQEAVDAIESDNTVRKYSIDDLKALKALYSKKLKELKSQ